MSSHAHRIEAPLSPDELAARWRGLGANPLYVDVPGKVEITEWGEILMNPPVGKSHGLLAMKIGRMLEQALQGRAMVEVGVVTAIGVRAPDVLWCSDGWLAAHPEELPLSSAPELWVEISSPTSTQSMLREKAVAFVNAGAVEAWIVFAERRTVEIYGRGGRQPQTSFALDPAGVFD